MRSHVRLVVAMTVVAAGIGPLALPSTAAACPGVTSSGRWSSIDLPPVPPAVPGAAAYISSYAVAAGRPKLLYAAGGRQVFRSRDGGCSWQVAVSLDTAGSATAPSRLDPAYVFTNVIVPNTLPGATSSTVYALAVGNGLTVTPPVVLAVSRDDGATWRLSDPAPAQLVGDYPRCSTGYLLAGADPKAVYLSCANSGAVETFASVGLVRCWSSFYVSRDDGATWTPIEPGVAAGCPASRWSRFSAEPTTVADPGSPGWLWGARFESIDGSEAQRLMLSTDDGRTVKDLTAASIPGANPRIAVSARTAQGPRKVVLYGPAAVVLSTDGGVTATKLPLVPGPIDSRGVYVGVFFDRSGSALFALTPTAPAPLNDGGLAPYRYDLRSGRWTVLPPLPAPKDNPPYLSQFRSDGASRLGLYALASPNSSTTPARLVVFR